jgi:hypothetical protein
MAAHFRRWLAKMDLSAYENKRVDALSKGMAQKLQFISTVLKQPDGPTYCSFAGGGKLVLMYRWDAGDALRLIQKERVTSMSGVPVMSRELIAHPDFARTDLDLAGVSGLS